jgi:ABC-type Fe3+-hydroxamate transport system substrate-binding protein
VARRVFLCFVALALGCRAPAPSGALTLIDDGGQRTVLAGPARRLVSLVPATTELLFALGAGSAVVGRTRWCDYPPEAAAVPSVGDGMTPNVEAIVARRPDLVVAYRSASNAPAMARLRTLGIPVVELAVDRFTDFERATRLLAAATGRGAAGDSLIAATRRELDRVTVRPARPVSVFILAWDQPPMTLGAGSYLSEIIARAGGRNVFESEARPSFVVSIEAVVAQNPDVILVTGEGSPAIAARPEWQAVPAVRERRFVRIHSSMFNRPSPRMPAAVAELAGLLARRPE